MSVKKSPKLCGPAASLYNNCLLCVCVCVFAKGPRIEHITYVDMLGLGVALTCNFAQVGQMRSQHYEYETLYFVSAASSCVF